MKEKVVTESFVVNTKKLSRFLNKIHLDGKLNECVIKSVGNGVLVDALDPTNIVFMSLQSDIDLSAVGDLGIGEINLMYKYLMGSSTEEMELLKRGNKLSSSRGKVKLNYLLTDPRLIATNVEESGKIKELSKNCDIGFVLNKETSGEFLYFIDLLKSKTCFVKFEDGLVYLTGGLEHEHTFDLEVGKPTVGSTTKTLSFPYFSEYVVAILKSLDYDEENLPVMMFNSDNTEFPMIIIEGNNYWAVHPLQI